MALAAVVGAAFGVTGDVSALGASRSSHAVTPLQQRGVKLVGIGEIHRGEFGRSIVLSADGKTAAVGGSNDNSPTFHSKRGVLSLGLGAVWVFKRTGSTWKQQGPKIVGKGESGEGQFGASIALSGDGKELMVGAPADRAGQGSVWVFVWTGKAWRQQGKILTVTTPVPSSFGTGVALSRSGKTAVVGGAYSHTGVGSAWIFTRSGSTWKAVAHLTGTGESGTGQFGRQVAVSGNGTTVLIGAPGDDNGKGAAWVFVKHGKTWKAAGPKLVGKGASPEGDFGNSVALSATGTTAVVGAPVDRNGVGSVWVYTRSGNTWAKNPKRLSGFKEVGPGQFGDSVALSPTGDVVLVGGAIDNDGIGAAWTFARSGSKWIPWGAKLVGRGAVGKQIEFGVSVALSWTGAVAVVGGQGDANFAGAAWPFAAG